MSKLLDIILDLPYPTKCVFCRCPVSPGRPRLCGDCQENLPQAVRSRAAHIETCVSALSYEGEAAEAIRRFKFDGCQAYAWAFGELIAERIYEDLWGRFDVLTWAPLSPDRRRRRGYDQSQLLAKQAGKRLRLPVVSTLKKKRGVPQQSLTSSASERRANILGAYSVPNPEIVRDKRILLVDDILTTGSTVSECAKTLKVAGASEICCATLAKAPNKPGQ